MTGDASMPEMEIDMIPWLHFTGGDNFFFKTLRPSSHGAIAAACIVLILIAVFERYVSAMRSVLDAYWARKYGCIAEI
jgi:solute carrier family 31 (copper transporter), member 1